MSQQFHPPPTLGTLFGKLNCVSGLIFICAGFVGTIEMALKFIKLVINTAALIFEGEIGSMDFYSCIRYSFGSSRETLKTLFTNFS